jgi:hypothetical protein
MGLLGVLAVHLFRVVVELARTPKCRRSAPRRPAVPAIIGGGKVDAVRDR